MRKNETLELECLRVGADMEGVCDADGMAVFVPGALPGERVRAQITKTEKRYAFGRLLSVENPSPDRAEPPCPAYRLCGGCACQHMTYEATLRCKRAQVEDCFRRIARMDVPVAPLLPAEPPFPSRNKTSLPVQGEMGAPRIGFFQRRSHRVCDLAGQNDVCPVAMDGTAEAVRVVRAWMRRSGVLPYDEETRAGLVRHIVVRASRTDGVMVTLVTTAEKLPAREALLAALRAGVPNLRSVCQSVNPRATNVIMGESAATLWGADTLSETLCGIEFRISPLSFFQVNPWQAEKLYQTALSAAALTGRETLVDAYAGAGTLTLAGARRAARAIGIEIVPDAVRDARENAARNGVGNAEFHLGAVEDVLPRLVAEGLRPEVVLLDPPRKGIQPAVAEAIVRAAPARVVYVSCNPATQARDAGWLAEGGYRAERCQPVDMFPFASDVENVLVMTRGGGEETRV